MATSYSYLETSHGIHSLPLLSQVFRAIFGFLMFIPQQNVIKTDLHDLMSKSNESAISFLLLLVSASLITEKTLVFGSSTIVSEKIAKRPDPLRHFKRYGGDYDIRNKHYWASAVFTGIHGYTVGGLWLLSGIGFGSYIVLKNIYGRTPTISDQPNSSYLIVFFLIVLFTIFAMVASSVTIAENQKTLQRTKRLEETIIGAGDHTCQTMGEVKTSFIKMQTFLQQYNSNICKLLDYMARNLKKESLSIQSYIDKFRHSFDRALHTIYVVNLVIVSVNFALLVIGLVLLASHHRPAVIVLIFSCWILTTISWIMSGIDFFLHTFIEDTCSKLKNFKENPYNNTITEMLPCPKLGDTQKNLEQIGFTVHSFISEINSKILEMRQVFETNEQSEGHSTMEICDPFGVAPNYSYSPENCKHDSIKIGDLPNVISKFICYEANTSENCTSSGKFLPEAIYTATLAYCESIQELIDIYPDLSNLMECSSIKDVISDIVTRQCKPTKLSTKALWSSMLSFSLVMVVLVLLWCAKAIQDRGRSFTRWSIFLSGSRL